MKKIWEIGVTLQLISASIQFYVMSAHNFRFEFQIIFLQIANGTYDRLQETERKS